MKEKERAIVTGLVVLMLVLWIGFLLHQSPRFAGSFWGGVLGVLGAVLMLIPLAYLVVKRIKPLKRVISKRVSMRTLLAWHVYAGILGPILVLLHTGHKFESPLGIALTAMTLIVVLSGFVGRYLMNQFSAEIREKKETLSELEADYRQAASDLARHPDRAQLLRPFAGFFSRLASGLFIHENVAAKPASPSADVGTMVRLSESIADVEYAIKTHQTFKTWFGTWLRIHIVISILLYVLLVMGRVKPASRGRVETGHLREEKIRHLAFNNLFVEGELRWRIDSQWLKSTQSKPCTLRVIPVVGSLSF